MLLLHLMRMSPALFLLYSVYLTLFLISKRSYFIYVSEQLAVHQTSLVRIRIHIFYEPDMNKNVQTHTQTFNGDRSHRKLFSAYDQTFQPGTKEALYMSKVNQGGVSPRVEFKLSR